MLDSVVLIDVEDVELFKVRMLLESGELASSGARQDCSMILTYWVSLRANATADIGDASFASPATVWALPPPIHFLSVVYCINLMSPVWCWK